jgi:hypothetical protein
MAFKTRVQVLLCPHDQYLSPTTPPGLTWPRPAGVQVQLTATGATSAKSLGATDDKGVTGLSPELETGVYQVQIPGYDFAGTVNLDQGCDRKTVEVRLAPCDGRCLVLVQLTEEPAGTAVSGATVRIASSDSPSASPFAQDVMSAADGRVYATAPQGDGTLNFSTATAAGGGSLLPSDPDAGYTAAPSILVTAIPVTYWPAIQISVTPTITAPGVDNGPLTDSCVTLEYRGSQGVTGFSVTKKLDSGSGSAAGSAPAGTVTFEYPFPGMYVITVEPPETFGGLPIKNPSRQVKTQALASGGQLSVPAAFEVVDTQLVNFVVKTPRGHALSGDFRLQIIGPDKTVQCVPGTGTSFTACVPKNDNLVFKLDPDPAVVPKIKTKIGNCPLTMSVPEQKVIGPPGTNTIDLTYEYSITGQAVDEHGQAVAGAMVEILDEGQAPVDVVVADPQGNFELALEKDGTYYLGQYPGGGEVGIRERIEVHSNPKAVIQVRRGPGGGPPGGRLGGEALTDLSAYPVLTEAITTAGPPAPAAGGSAAGGPGAGYGQTVDQVMRDVLGWRPSGDVAGFQAALTGAFQLRQVEGHTEWSWQQRGYAVQADMGALTGAQASIYARAKNALDQMLPLLAGLTAINPALYPPQDLEAIRTVIAAELQELVNELALEGGPRIQRVDELFRLLTGESKRSLNPDPDTIQGQLGLLRDRFGLTVAYVDTVDEERIVTNFRIVVEQVLTLQESWESDRRLLSVLDSNTSLGTLLIWLSRGLEAVCESVDDLTFALDSVFVDAAQRQVIQLDFTNQSTELPELPLWKGNTKPYSFKGKQAPILLSDLLDWVVRACRDEGPRIVQDAGKDGVLAFAPVLNELRILIHATRGFTRTPKGATLPDGMRTPRVRRALEVLAGQLDEAADLAALVRRDGIPEITGQTVTPGKTAGHMEVTLTGTNFRPRSSAFLYAENREEIADMPARYVRFEGPSKVVGGFRIPKREDAGGRLIWQVVLTNEDGTTSEPVAITIPRQV